MTHSNCCGFTPRRDYLLAQYIIQWHVPKPVHRTSRHQPHTLLLHLGLSAQLIKNRHDFPTATITLCGDSPIWKILQTFTITHMLENIQWWWKIFQSGGQVGGVEGWRIKSGVEFFWSQNGAFHKILRQKVRDQNRYFGKVGPWPHCPLSPVLLPLTTS